MTLYDFYLIAKDNSGLSIIICLVILKLVDISKIPINPWKWIVKKIRLICLGDMPSKVDTIDKKLEGHIIESDERDLRKRRESILDFASAIGIGRRYTKEQYEQMLKECDDYATYCHKKQFVNSVADESINLIRRSYSENLKIDGFLKIS